MKNHMNQKGIALLLVMGVIAILSFILFEFTFETKLNKIKIYNQQDRFQARLNAEAGLNFALGKLRLYQEGRNMIEKNESVKSSFPSSDLENILIQPFMLPIPLSKSASIIQTNALKEFEKNTIIRGEMSVTISKISGLLNPNSLRIVDKAPPSDSEFKEDPDMAKIDATVDAGEDPAKSKTNRWETTRALFLKTITQMMEEKLLKDEAFHNVHANTKPDMLLNELAFYVNDISKSQAQEFADAKNKFNQKNITPKHGPMASIEELYLLPSWDDTIVEMFKERMSVNELTSIPVNEMNNLDLKILFPEINEIQTEEFFKYRDGDPDKKIKATKFKNADDFKSIVTGKLNIINESEYQKRIIELKSAGLVIDTAGKLYKISSKGIFNNANYTIVAIVDLPVKEQPKKPKQKGTAPPLPGAEDNTETENPNETVPGVKDPNKAKEGPVELLQPRVVEIRAE